MAGAEVLMSYHDAMDDYDLPELSAQEVHERVEDWMRRLDELFARIRTWAAAHGVAVKDGEPRTMLEERMERVGEPARAMLTLVLRSAEGAEVSIKPKALWVIGANGRVDVLSRKSGVYVLIDRAEPLEPPQWILRKVGAGGDGRAFDPELLAELI
jgi:plasmid stability protein